MNVVAIPSRLTFSTLTLCKSSKSSGPCPRVSALSRTIQIGVEVSQSKRISFEHMLPWMSFLISPSQVFKVRWILHVILLGYHSIRCAMPIKPRGYAFRLGAPRKTQE